MLFLSRWKEEEKGETFRAEVVAYADDFVILSRGSAEQSLEWTRTVNGVDLSPFESPFSEATFRFSWIFSSGRFL